MDRDILFKDFSLEEHERMWNKLVYHMEEAAKIHDYLRKTLPILHPSEKTEKSFSYPWINYRFTDFVYSFVKAAGEFAGGIKFMKIKKEKGYAR